MPIHLNSVILPRANHGFVIDINPEANALVTADALEHLLGLDVPEDDATVLAGRGNKGAAIEEAEASTDSELVVLMALVCLLDATGDVVPQADRVVEVECQDETAV